MRELQLAEYTMVSTHTWKDELLQELESSDNDDEAFNSERLSTLRNRNMETEDASAGSLVMGDSDDESFTAVVSKVAESYEEEKWKRKDMGESTKVNNKGERLIDFIKNVLLQLELTKTLQSFQVEWRNRQSNDFDICNLSSIFEENEQLRQQIIDLEHDLNNEREMNTKAGQMYDELKKKRDFHRSHHRRLENEKKRLLRDLNREKKKLQDIQPTIDEIQTKYKNALRAKSALEIDHDRQSGKLERLKEMYEMSTSESRGGLQEMSRNSSQKKQNKKCGESLGRRLSDEPKNRKKNDAQKKHLWPESSNQKSWSEVMPQPNASKYVKMEDINSIQEKHVLKCHDEAVTSISTHPHLSLLATTSDDGTWKSWSLDTHELIMKGQGHSDWIGSGCFSPSQAHLHYVSSSGDGSIKLWDLLQECCVNTFTFHTAPVWSVVYHPTGTFILSASMDHSMKLIDIDSLKVQRTYRGHTDSINSAKFHPSLQVIGSASADKTVSLWDIRTGMCVQTLFGHEKSCNALSFDATGYLLASADSAGSVFVWDIRSVRAVHQVVTGAEAANSICFHPSQSLILIACENSTLQIFDASQGNSKGLDGHTNSVQDVTFNNTGSQAFSCALDGTVRIWS